ncbi:urea transporter [Shinella zoogloeoides]|uniref:urea transporter n=1 Tax=Shinella zoogloeoides TaxID=352475 RepID=UPI00273D962D|nr:urea transporter [Shinella zoogloeoides]WLR95089.1 urea transporter [Shinella zoogloeoides]
MQVDRFRDHPFLSFVDWSLRGIGQVVFQNNPLSGLIILAAVALNSWIYAAICVLGVAASTATAVILKADRAILRDGLYGFNGALVALALVAFTSEDFRSGAVPSPAMLAYLICAAAMTTMAFASITAVLAPHRIAALTMPFVLVGWLFLFAILKFDALDAGPMGKPVSPEYFTQTMPYVFSTWYRGVGTSIGQIFFQDNWITGYVILAGIAVNSRICAAMGLLGAIAGTAIAALYGGPETAVRDGLFGYNSALTAMALGGVFLVLTWRSLLYALFGAAVASWLWVSITTFLSPLGMPALTSSFVLVTWLMLLGQGAFKALVPVPPAQSTTPEENRARYLASQSS